MIRHSDRADQSDLDHFLQQACHSSLRASVNHTHILDMGKGGELMKLKKMQVGALRCQRGLCDQHVGCDCIGCWAEVVPLVLESACGWGSTSVAFSWCVCVA